MAPHPRQQYAIVASLFAFLVLETGGKPDERIGPIDCAGDLRKKLPDKIVAQNVHPLVRQYGIETIGVPVHRIRREQDLRHKDTDYHRH